MSHTAGEEPTTGRETNLNWSIYFLCCSPITWKTRNNVLLAAKEDPLTGLWHTSLSLCASWFTRLSIA